MLRAQPSPPTLIRRLGVALSGTMLIAVLATYPAAAAAAPPPILVEADHFAVPPGGRVFLTAINYEGPSDRTWAMWRDDTFDLRLIDADFQRARAAGANALRIFVQADLVRDVALGRWEKLDQVVRVAEQRGLPLILSLHDYGERDLVSVSATAGRIAARYSGRGGIFAYDLKNEPRFGDLAFARYSRPVPLQQQGLIDNFGPRITQEEVPEFRAKAKGFDAVPGWMTDYEAWNYVNNLRLYREFLADASRWVASHPGRTTVDFMGDAASEPWQALIAALDDSLRAWPEPQVAAIRAADHSTPITVGHVDAALARLSANDMLDFQTLHRYPSASAAGIRSALALVGSLRDVHAGQPYVLGEFGFANDQIDPDRTSLLETATILGLRARGAAGGAKWMLTDLPEGPNMRERSMGAYTVDGQPKPVVAAFAALGPHLGPDPISFTLAEDPEAGVRYVYRAPGRLLLGGQSLQTDGASLDAGKPAQVFLDFSETAVVRIWASSAMQVDLDLDALGVPHPAAPRLVAARATGEEPRPLAGQDGPRLRLQLEQGNYLLRLTTPGAAPR